MTPYAGLHAGLHAGLDSVPELVGRCLATASRGVVALALDGLSHAVGAQALAHARVSVLRSTFPSTSTTGWLTAVTGVDPSRHGAIGMVYRAPGAGHSSHLISGKSLAYAGAADDPGGETVAGRPLIEPAETIFERATAAGFRAWIVGAELETLSGEWVEALTRGAEIAPSPADRLTKDPVDVVERTVREVEAVLAKPSDAPILLWAYVNLDEHIHLAGYDDRLSAALRLLDEAAQRWGEAGWSVLAHADHGQVPVTPNPDLTDAWNRLDSARFCRMPGGGAGRTRWLYPEGRREAEVADRLREALAGHALVLTADDLDARGLLTATDVVRDRIGSVVAVATSPSFPVPDPALACEHGGLAEDEVLVPLAAWGPARDTPPPAHPTRQEART